MPQEPKEYEEIIKSSKFDLNTGKTSNYLDAVGASEEAGSSKLRTIHAGNVATKTKAYESLYYRLKSAKARKEQMSPLDGMMWLYFNNEMYDEWQMTQRYAKFKGFLKSPDSPIYERKEQLQAYTKVVKDRMRVTKHVERQYKAFSAEQFIKYAHD